MHALFGLGFLNGGFLTRFSLSRRIHRHFIVGIALLSASTSSAFGAFLPDANGLVVMEAENYEANVAQGNHTWEVDSTAGFVGTSAMRAMPDNGAYEDTNFGTDSPRLDYEVDFANTGYLSVWVRGFGHSWNSDSVWISINGDTANAKLVIPSKSGFGWKRAPGGVYVPSTGVHTINIWFREDGTSVDRVLITPDGSYTPTGDGPAESAQSGGSSNSAPVLDPIGHQSITEGQTLSFTVTASDVDAPPQPALTADLTQLSGSPTYSDNSDGTANFSWTPAAGEGPAALSVTFTATDAVDSSLTDTETITINVLEAGSGGSGAYLPDSSGMVVMEAENFDGNVPQGNHTWAVDTTAGYVGASAIQAVPDSGSYLDTTYGTTSPRLDFEVDFAATGYQSVWIRGLGHSWNSDSVWISIDGDAASAILAIPPKTNYGWDRASGGGFYVPSTGVHTVNVWFREDGTNVDRILITPDGSYVPSGDGPPESSRSAGGGNNPPVANNDAFSVDQDTTDNALAVLANNGSGADSDPDNDPLTVSGVDSTGSAGSAVSINGTNNGLLYTPAAAYTGVETFNYTISDGAGGTDSAIVTVTVQSTGAGAPSIPTNLTGPTTDADGNYSITWNTSSGSTFYELEELLGAGGWANEYSGANANHSVPGNDPGFYAYRVRGCNDLLACSDWSGSVQVQVTGAPSPPTPPTPPAPPAPAVSERTGVLPASFDVDDNGAAIYTIPIQVVEGMNGMTPEMALVYNHRQDESIAGVGWGVSGLSAITRCVRTILQDGGTGAVTLTSADRFCIDGVQLRLVSGSYGAANSTYRSEVDTAARYTAKSTAGTGPAWFEVEDKNGLIYEYGNSADSRIESQASGATSTALTWALNKISDRYGNVIQFTYIEDGAPLGAYRISRVEYMINPTQGQTFGNDFIQFEYESHPTGDVDIQYVAGGVIEDSQRLDRVDVFHGPSPSQLVRRYEVTYEPNLSSANKSRVSTIEECGGTPYVCLPATTFTYQDGSPGFGSSSSFGIQSPTETRVLPMDINGDGRTDIVYPSSATNGTWLFSLANTSGSFGPGVQDSGISSLGHENAIIGDYNNDGSADILVPFNGTTWYAIQGSAAGLLSPLSTTAPLTNTAGNAVSIDMNGDGLEDLVYGENVGNEGIEDKLWVRYRMATGAYGFSANPVELFAGGSFYFVGPIKDTLKQSHYRETDFNGDGRRDLVLKRQQPGGYSETIALLAPDSGQSAQAITLSTFVSNGLPVDINGDGYTDVIYNDTQFVANIRFSNGKTLGAPETMGLALAGLDLSHAIVVDWNSDGFEDVMLPNTSLNAWYYFQSTGAGLEQAVDTGIQMSSPRETFSVDTNGDGLVDIAYINSGGAFSWREHAGIKPDLLATARDGFGVGVDFNYESLANGPYEKYTDAPLHQQDYIGPTHVVESADFFRNAADGNHTLTYTYAGARIESEGRGLSGFDKKTTHDSRNGATVSEYFERDFPYRGRQYRREVAQADDTLVQTRTFDWDSVSGGAGFQTYHFPYVSQSVEKNYAVGSIYNGAQLNEVTKTVNVIDAYGTVTDISTVTEETAGGNGGLPGATYTEQVVLGNVINNQTSWCIGLPSQTTVMRSDNQPFGVLITRRLDQVWDSSVSCGLTQEITELGDPDYAVTRTYGRDGFGNITADTIAGAGMTPRTTVTNWQSSQFPHSITNALGQSTAYTWNTLFGELTSVTDPNGLTTSRSIDSYGRQIRLSRTDRTYTDIEYFVCGTLQTPCLSYGLASAETLIKETSRDAFNVQISTNETFLDQLGNPVRRTEQTLSGAKSISITSYNPLGQVATQSPPEFTETPAFATIFSYDILNRPITITRPTDASNSSPHQTVITYDGLTTTVVDAEGGSSHKIVNALGQVYRSIDQNGYYQQFEYDAFGSIKRVSDSANTLQEYSYDYGVGVFRISSNDADMGSWTYQPNALGEVVSYTDANGQNFSMTFDALSRPATRTEPDNATTWTWGTSAAANNIGRLESVASTGHSEAYDFDDFGRLSRKTTTADTIYETDISYDNATGFLDSITYPESTGTYRLKVKYNYQFGSLASVAEFDSPTNVFWQANATDARGNVIDMSSGNGLDTIRGFDTVTGQLDYIQTGPGGSTTHQDMEFLWNRVGSLKQRKDVNRALTEDFFYDSMHRLDYSELNGVQNLDVGYDQLGNINFKSDVGAGNWTYHATKKHAVTSAGSNTYTYDDNGNQITRNGDNVTWTSYNYPQRIENGSGYHEFSYDAYRQRWKQEYNDGTGTETTIFVGGIFEKRSTAVGTEYRHYINAGGQAVALHSRELGSDIGNNFFLLDHLGSVAGVTSDAGVTALNLSFDAFGQRRDSNTWAGAPSAASISEIADTSQRGFTFHTNLEGGSLVHMNGRVADALTGRFLSADPFIPNAGLTQSFNRYSYVNNDPLSFTDPSGFTPCFGPDAAFCLGVIRTVGNFLFGKSGKKGPPPVQCYVATSGCYGSSTGSKLFDMVSDVLCGPFGCQERNDLIILNVQPDESDDEYNDGGFFGFGRGLFEGAVSVFFPGGVALGVPGVPVIVLGRSPESVFGEADTNQREFGRDLGPVVPIGGVGGTLRGAAAAANGLRFGKKLDFLLNKDINPANPDNVKRAIGNANRIGIADTPANRAELTRRFNDAFKNPATIVGPGKTPGSNLREFFLPGVTGTGSKIQFSELNGKVITIIAK